MKKPTINQALIDNQVLCNVLSLMVHFEWNNQLLINVEKIINLIFEEDSTDLQEDLLNTFKLLDFIVENTRSQQC